MTMPIKIKNEDQSRDVRIEKHFIDLEKKITGLQETIILKPGEEKVFWIHDTARLTVDEEAQ